MYIYIYIYIYILLYIHIGEGGRLPKGGISKKNIFCTLDLTSSAFPMMVLGWAKDAAAMWPVKLAEGKKRGRLSSRRFRGQLASLNPKPA